MFDRLAGHTKRSTKSVIFVMYDYEPEPVRRLWKGHRKFESKLLLRNIFSTGGQFKGQTRGQR